MHSGGRCAIQILQQYVPSSCMSIAVRINIFYHICEKINASNKLQRLEQRSKNLEGIWQRFTDILYTELSLHGPYLHQYLLDQS